MVCSIPRFDIVKTSCQEVLNKYLPTGVLSMGNLTDPWQNSSSGLLRKQDDIYIVREGA
jgi:hypothetical protein